MSNDIFKKISDKLFNLLSIPSKYIDCSNNFEKGISYKFYVENGYQIDLDTAKNLTLKNLNINKSDYLVVKPSFTHPYPERFDQDTSIDIVIKKGINRDFITKLAFYKLRTEDETTNYCSINFNINKTPEEINKFIAEKLIDKYKKGIEELENEIKPTPNVSQEKPLSTNKGKQKS